MDNDTLTSVFERMRQRLLVMAGRMLGNEDDAADAVQDAFCRLWQRRESVGSETEAEGVSVVTVRNLCVDNLRRNSKAVMVSIDDNKNVDETADDTSDVEERKAVFEEVNAIMESYLNETQLKVLKMREYEGRSYEEIAEFLGMQQANVRMILSRSRKLVREIYRNKI